MYFKVTHKIVLGSVLREECIGLTIVYFIGKPFLGSKQTQNLLSSTL